MPPAQIPSFVTIGWPKTVLLHNIQYYCSNMQPRLEAVARSMKWEDSYLVKLAVHATATVGMLAERQRCGWLGWGGFAGSTGESQFGAMTKLLLQYQILQERDHAIVDTDDDAMMEDD